MLQIFCYILKNPKDVKKKLNPMLTPFADIFNNPARDNYVEGLMNGMSKLTIMPEKQYAVKRKLSEFADFEDSDPDMTFSSNDEDEMPETLKKKRKAKNTRKIKCKY